MQGQQRQICLVQIRMVRAVLLSHPSAKTAEGWGTQFYPPLSWRHRCGIVSGYELFGKAKVFRSM
jgi:hypothetical protein